MRDETTACGMCGRSNSFFFFEDVVTVGQKCSLNTSVGFIRLPSNFHITFTEILWHGATLQEPNELCDGSCRVTKIVIVIYAIE